MLLFRIKQQKLKDVANISAQKKKKGKSSRVSQKKPEAWGEKGPQSPPSQGEKKARALTASMLAKKNRLTAEDFFSSNQKSARIEHIGARFWPNSLSRNRFAVVMSSKTEPSSVIRHRLKRKVIESVKKWPALGLDVVLSLPRKVKREEEVVLVGEISDLLHKITKIVR